MVGGIQDLESVSPMLGRSRHILNPMEVDFEDRGM